MHHVSEPRRCECVLSKKKQSVNQRERCTSQEASNNEQDHAPSTLARRVSLECENCRVRLKGILVEQDSEVHVVSVRPELIGDVCGT